MRNDFVKQTIEEMHKNKDIVFLTGDLGFNALEPVKAQFSERFYNVGIAEANMVGMACGLAREGKKVICYSIASFAVLRAYEQIRLDVCYDCLDIKIIGAGGGFNYAAHGVTHHTLEDFAALSALPNMRIANPAYSDEARQVTKEMLQCRTPCYARFGKNPTHAFPKASMAKTGEEILILSTGNLLERSLKAAEMLEQRVKKSVGVLSVPWIKPLDTEYLAGKINHACAVFTIEEHNVIGGFGSLVAKFLAERVPYKKIFEAFGIQDVFHKEVGTRDYLLDQAGLAPGVLAKKMERKLEACPT